MLKRGGKRSLFQRWRVAVVMAIRGNQGCVCDGGITVAVVGGTVKFRAESNKV